MIGTDLPAFQKTMQTNLQAPLVWSRHAWDQRMRDHGGVIINIASVGALMHGGNLGAYDVSKAALIHLTKHLAVELGPRVRVNAIAPGLVRTSFARALWESSDPDRAWPWPLRRIGSPEDIAKAALYLASDLSSWVTGQVLIVDGGASLGSPEAGQEPAGQPD
jgi:NAD(P)-dependent dehydrogenase (short-subunit alcohol dehydrogenase family)